MILLWNSMLGFIRTTKDIDIQVKFVVVDYAEEIFFVEDMNFLRYFWTPCINPGISLARNLFVLKPPGFYKTFCNAKQKTYLRKKPNE